MKRISSSHSSSDGSNLLSERIGLRPIAILLAGLQLFMPVSVSVASVVQAVTSVEENEQLNQDNQLATHLARAAGLVQTDNSQAAKSYATGMASGAVNSAAGEWLSQFGTAQVNLGLDQNLKAAGSSLDMLVPLYDSPKAMLFTQFGARHQDSRNTVNIGTGVRTFTDSNWMFGGNIFFDNDLSGNNRRVGLGLEAWTDYLKISGNHYFGLTDWHQSKDLADYDERPANGWDIRAEGWLPAYAQLGGKLMFEKYYGKEVALIGNDSRHKNPSAVTAGVNWTPFPLLTLGAEHRAASGGQQDSQVSMTMTVRPGDSLDKHLDPSAVAATRTLAGSRADLVERNNNIVLEYRKQELMTLSVPTALSGAAATVLTVQANVKTKYGLKDIDWHAPQLESDGGRLAVVAPDQLAVTLPARARALPYVLTGVARDTRGNVSERAVTHITVVKDEGHSAEKTVIPSTLPADGQSTARVQLTLKNSGGQPVIGQADEMQISVKLTPIPSLMMARASSMMMRLMNNAPAEPQVSAYREVAPGVYEATLTAGNEPGNLVITTTWRGEELRTTSLVQVKTEDVTEAQLAADALVKVSDGAIANGIASNSVKATVTDANGKLLENQTVEFSASNGAVINRSGTTDVNGEVVMLLTNTKSGVSTVIATINNSSQSVDVTFVAGPGIPGAAVVGNDQAPANGTDTITVTFPVTDANGNPAPGQSVDITITYPDGSTGNQTVVTDSNGNANVDIVSTQPGTVTVEGNANGSSSTADVEFTADASGAVIMAGDFVVVNSGAVANGIATNSVRAKVTHNGVPLPQVRVNFSASNNATITTSAHQRVTDANGEILLTLTNTRAGVSTVSASINNSTQTADVTFVAGTGTPGTGTITGNGAVANGSDTITVTFPVTDANGNPAPDQSVDITITYPDGSTDTQTVVTDSNGNATVNVDSTQAGNVTVEAAAGGGSSSSNVDFVADSTTATLAAGSLVMVTDNAVANGTATNSVRATVTDAKGNRVSGVSVGFSANNGATIAATGTSNANGEIVQTLTSTTAGVSTVTAVLGSASVTADVTFVAGMGTPGTGNVTGNGAVANGSDTITVTFPVTDANGNPAPGQSVDITITYPDGSTDTQTVVTDSNGNATVDVDSTQAGSVTVEAAAGGGSSSSNIDFVADSNTATLAAGSLVMVTDNAVANGTATNSVRATVTDANGNRVSGVSVDFSASNSATIAATGTSDANGEIELTLTSNTAGVSTVTAVLGSASVTVDVTFIGDSATATLAAGSLVMVTDNAVANGTATNSVKATVTDANGNRVSGVSVNFSASNSATIAATGTSDANGEIELTLTSTTAGVSTVTAVLGSASVTADVTFIADSNTATLAAGSLVMVTDNAVANGTATNSVRATVTDANGNRVSGVSVGFSVSNGATIAATGTSDANGEIELTLTSNAAGVSTVTAVLGSASVTVDVTFIGDSATATLAAGSLVMVTDNAVANGTATNSVKATVTDANGNPVSGVSVGFSANNGASIAATGTSDANGEIELTLTSTTAGISTVTAVLGSASVTADVTFVADSTTATLAAGSLVVVTDNAIASGTVDNSVKATVTDANGNPVSGVSVSFSASNSATIAATGTSDANGEIELTLTSTRAGTSTVTAVLGSASVTTNVSFVTPTITITKVLDTQLAMGKEANTFKITVKGFQGALVPDQAVNLSTREATSVIDVGATANTDANGELAVGVTNPGAPGTTDILYATVAGTTVQASASHSWMEKYNFTNKTDVTTIGTQGVTTYSVRRTCTWTVTTMTTGQPANVSFGFGLRQANAILGTKPQYPSNGTNLAVSGGTFTVTSDIGWGGAGVANTQNFQLRVGSMANVGGGNTAYLVANDGKINCSAVDAYND